MINHFVLRQLIQLQRRVGSLTDVSMRFAGVEMMILFVASLGNSGYMQLLQPSHPATVTNGDKACSLCRACHDVINYVMIVLSNNVLCGPNVVVSGTDVVFKLGEAKTLPCITSGQMPALGYTWNKDGYRLTFSSANNGTLQLNTVTGSLMIQHVSKEDAGQYQCFVKTPYGIAVGAETTLTEALLDPFPSIKEMAAHRPIIGSPLTLNCQPPASIPAPEVYWGMNLPGPKLKPVETTNRIALDYKGNLHFVNVNASDGIGGSPYVCVSYNSNLRTLVQGDDQSIHPIAITATPKYLPPRLMWSSATSEVALKGRIAKMKCIFSGFPTPRISWRRIDAANLPRNSRVESYGQELRIHDVEYDDAGDYECTAMNTEAGSFQSSRFSLIVHSLPFLEIAPNDLEVLEGQDIVFPCVASGVPRPTVAWLSNGQLLPEQAANDRLTIQPGSLKISNVMKSDVQVIQCNATNSYGYVLVNAYLNVRAEAPILTQRPDREVKVVEGHTITLTCRAVGGPLPVITWQHDSANITDDPNVIQHPNGDLQIKNVSLADHGDYTCEAFNKYGSDKTTATVVIRRRTKIVEPSVTLTVRLLTNATLRCMATSDPAEVDRLTVQWLHPNNQSISDSVDGRIRLSYNPPGEVFLHFAPVLTADSGNYSCWAGNGLDLETRTSYLIVQDRPLPPVNVSIRSCEAASAVISWNPGFDNNDKITGFTVYYNTSFDGWGQYKAAVTTNITTVTPMVAAEHNGDKFHYIVRYRLTSSLIGDVKKVERWRQNELVIANQPTFAQYEISVEAVNVLGSAPADILETVIGYSGEDAPLTAPTNVYVNEASINSTSVELFWDPVDQSVENIRGFFRGYQIRFWRQDDPSTVRTEDVIISVPNLCVRKNTTGTTIPPRVVRNVNVVRGQTHKLWPYATINAVVFTMNSAKFGPASKMVVLRTLPGPPGAVAGFGVTEIGSNHVRVSWMPTPEPNGVVTGYVIRCEPKSDQLTDFQELNVVDPLHRSFVITDLQNDTTYVLNIWAVNSADRGAVAVLEITTLPLSAPDAPLINKVEPGDDFVIVSWQPSKPPESFNPASVFYVNYRQQHGTHEWRRVDTVGENNWVNITDLENGQVYELCVVGVNGMTETGSDVVKVLVSSDKYASVPQSHRILVPLWWLVLIFILIIAVLVIAIVVVCALKRCRGNRLCMRKMKQLQSVEDEDINDNMEFGEISQLNGRGTLIKRLASADSTTRSTDSDDSLGEYGDPFPDPTKFNEDGSFIGQYVNSVDDEITAAMNVRLAVDVGLY